MTRLRLFADRAGRAGRAGRAAPIVLVILGPLLWCGDVLLGKVPYWGATFLQFQPWWAAVGAAYQAGRLPLWLPESGFGAPLAANPQAMAFSPFALLSAIFPAEHALGLTILIHAEIAAVGGYLAARRLGAPPAAAAIAGVILPLAGALASRAIFVPFYTTSSWIGLAIAAWPTSWRRSAPVSPAIVLGLAWLDGHPQAWLMVAIASLARGIGVALAPEGTRGNHNEVVGPASLPAHHGHYDGPSEAHSLGGTQGRQGRQPYAYVIEALQRAAGWAALQRAGRAAVPRTVARLLLVGLAPIGGLLLAAVQAVPAAELLINSVRSAGLPDVLVRPYDPPLLALLLGLVPQLFGSPVLGTYVGPVGFWEWSWYAGGLALVLAATAPRRGVGWWLVVGGLIAALLPGLPGIGEVGRLLAGGSFLRGAGRFFILVDAGIALLAAAGLAALIAEDRPVRRQQIALVTLAVGSGLTLGGVLGALVGTTAGFTDPGFARAGSLFVWIGLGILVAGRLGPRWGGVALSAVTLAELIVFSRPLLPLTDPAIYRLPGPAADSITEDPIFVAAFFRAFSLRTFAGDPALAATLPNRGILSGARDLLSYDPLRLADADRIVRTATNAADPDLALSRLTSPPRLARRAVFLPDDQALARLFDPRFSVTDTVILADRPNLPPSDGPAEPPLLRVEAAPGRVVIESSSPDPAFLATRFADYPGWRATVDGQAVPILRADGGFQAIALSAGRHTTVLTYQPWTLTVGAAISAVSWFTALAILLRRRWRRPSGPGRLPPAARARPE